MLSELKLILFMPKKRFKFPAGTTKISAIEIKEVLCNYEVVEVPGSVIELNIKVYQGTYEKDIVTRRLILNEGTQIFKCQSQKNMPVIEYNVPNSLCDISDSIGQKEPVGFFAPKVLCLPISFRRAEGIRGVEYLQAYCASDIRYNRYNLKHYVYLGTNVSQKCGIFNGMDEGGVIHVENKKVALSVLKKCSFMKVYVIPDALEWKDFPADKLSMTMEEYNPESRMLPEQRKMREERTKQMAEEEQQQQAELRQIQKRRKLEALTENVVKVSLAPVFGDYEAESFRGVVGPNNQLVMTTSSKPAYDVDIQEDKESDKETLVLKAIAAQNLWKDYNKNMSVEMKMLPEEIMEKKDDITRVFLRLRDFVTAYRETFEKYKITFGNRRQSQFYSPGLTLPFQDNEIIAQLNDDTLQEDVKTVKGFVDAFSNIIKEGNESFPLGFHVDRVGKI